MLLRTTVQVTDPGLIDAYKYQLQHAPEVVNTLVNRTMNDERDRLLADLQQEPGNVVHPIRWKSDRQRRAYFASNGFGHGIPYHRRQKPNRMVDQWRLIVVYQPEVLTSILLENKAPERRFVIGRDQQPFHKITGWYDEDVKIERSRRYARSKVETALIRSFYAVEVQ